MSGQKKTIKHIASGKVGQAIGCVVRVGKNYMGEKN